MSFTATQYLFKPSVLTASTTATVGGYVVPAATRGQILALTLSNTSTVNIMNYADVALFDGTTANNIVTKMPIFPGGAGIVVGVEKHILPTGGAVYVTPYATGGLMTAALSLIEVV